MVDWTKPIEAVHVNGLVVPAEIGECDNRNPSTGRYVVNFEGDGNGVWFLDSGKANIKLDWTIRNREEPANDELAELRAFKEAALAKYPELAQVDPDFAEAKNLMQESDWGSGTECKTPDDPGFDGSVCDLVLKGIKRGRELERYAQGLTTPKD